MTAHIKTQYNNEIIEHEVIHVVDIEIHDNHINVICGFGLPNHSFFNVVSLMLDNFD